MTTAETTFHVDFVSELSDFIALNKSAMRVNPIRHVRRAIFLLGLIGAPAFAILFFLVPEAGLRSSAIWSAVFGGLCGVAAISIISLLAGNTIRKQQFQKSALANRRIQMAISDGGLDVRIDGIETKAQWSAIRRLDVLDDNIFCFIDNRQAFVIARRGLVGADWPDLIAFIRERCPGRG